MDWKMALLATGSAVAAAAFAYYLMSSEPEEKEALAKTNEEAPLDSKTITKEKLYKIVQDVIKGQEELKTFIEDWAKKISTNSYSFEEVYEKMQKSKPADALEAYGLDLNELDKLLNKYQNLPWVHSAYLKIMGAFDNTEYTAACAKISSSDLLAIHDHMVKVFQQCIKDAEVLAKTVKPLDPKLLSMAAQAISSASVTQKFNVQPIDVEGAIQIHHQELAADPKFSMITQEMQETMLKLIESRERMLLLLSLVVVIGV